jgi:hypothetical protein
MRKPERENQSRLAGCISERARLSFRAGPVEFQSGPDKKNRPTRNDSSAHQIALFSLLKINKMFFSSKGRSNSLFHPKKHQIADKLLKMSCINTSW